MSDDGFKLPGSSYAELAKIIRAYGHSPDDASPKDVADRAGTDPTVVSRSNAFLVAVGIAEGKQKKTLTLRGRTLAQAIDHEIQDQIASAWRAIALESDFLRKILSAVRIRGGMELSSLRSHVAYTAGAAKTPSAMAGAGSVVDVLTVAGFLREENGKIVALQDDSSLGGSEATEGPKLDSPPGGGTKDVPPGPALPSSPSPVATSLQIQVRIDCTPDQVSDLAQRLRDMLGVLYSAAPSKDASDK